jgi:hypothetical protein
MLALSMAIQAPEARAQNDLRKSFPGRRVGGGTRGDCSSRVLAHLVPVSSVFAPGRAGYLGVLEGPSASPSPLELSFRPLSGRGSEEGSGPSGQRRVLPPSEPGITLLTLPALKLPTVWESAYACPQGAEAGAPGDPLNFVATVAPPARSLLVTEASREDTSVQAALARLHSACGATVSRQEVAAAFGLADLITDRWPERIPVRCPG